MRARARSTPWSIRSRRISISALLLLALLTTTTFVPAARGEESPATPTLPPKGQVVPKFATLADPAKSYALYLPSAYDPTRRSPIVYLLDARGVALNPIERYRAGAERYGFILASAYDSASDVPHGDPNLEALQTMWTDTHARLAIDDRRVYVGGFSGTVRSACAIATLAPGKIAGILASAAGFPPEMPPNRQTPFLFFGTTGDRDFNFTEMFELDAKLSALELPHRIEEFAGPHDWCPEPLATAGLEWMELQAMKAGIRERDPALIEALWSARAADARALEAAGKPFPAWHRWQAMSEDFTGLRDVAEASREAVRLNGEKAVRTFREERAARAARDGQYLRGAYRTLGDLAIASDPGAVRRLVGSLRIADLKADVAKRGETEKGLESARLLSALSGQTSFYLPREAMEKKEFARAARYLEIAVDINPENPGAWYNLAAARARGGNTAGALEALRRGVAVGISNPDRLEGDPDF
ncbi:MAG TPA: tetratricopeptide repeat protein, partial [Thermoanaerobaculia bacterium]|nr:tetratricopeptide repeat protein [Thermoanaerobaculia bacterium]